MKTLSALIEPVSDRECPHCWEPLVEEQRDVFGPDVTVDVCPECEGEFLDEGEIKRLTGDRDLHELLTEYLAKEAESELVCPNCGGLMDAELVPFEDGDVEVDACHECHGLWLDDGELAKLQRAEVDVDDLDDAKLAELWDRRTSGERRRGLLGRLLGKLRR